MEEEEGSDLADPCFLIRIYRDLIETTVIKCELQYVSEDQQVSLSLKIVPSAPVKDFVDLFTATVKGKGEKFRLEEYQVYVVRGEEIPEPLENDAKIITSLKFPNRQLFLAPKNKRINRRIVDEETQEEEVEEGRKKKKKKKKGVRRLYQQLDVAFNRPSASHLRNLRKRQEGETVETEEEPQEPPGKTISSPSDVVKLGAAPIPLLSKRDIDEEPPKEEEPPRKEEPLKKEEPPAPVPIIIQQPPPSPKKPKPSPKREEPKKEEPKKEEPKKEEPKKEEPKKEEPKKEEPEKEEPKKGGDDSLSLGDQSQDLRSPFRGGLDESVDEDFKPVFSPPKKEDAQNISPNVQESDPKRIGGAVPLPMGGKVPVGGYSLANPIANPAASLLAKDRRVAIEVEGEANALVHFDMGQAFAWEFLRKKQRITKEDYDYAMKMQRTEEKKLAEQAELKRLQMEELSEGDEDYARLLAERNSLLQSLNVNQAPHNEDLRLSALEMSESLFRDYMAGQQQQNSPPSSPSPPRASSPPGASSPPLFLRSSSPPPKQSSPPPPNRSSPPPNRYSAPPVARGDSPSHIDQGGMMEDDFRLSVSDPQIDKKRMVKLGDDLTQSTQTRTWHELTKARLSRNRAERVEKQDDLDLEIALKLQDGLSLSKIFMDMSSTPKIWGMVENLRCFKTYQRGDIVAGPLFGNNVYLPISVRDYLDFGPSDVVHLDIVNPYLPNRQRIGGVLNFVNMVGIAIVPDSILKDLKLEEGDVAQFCRIVVPPAQSAIFQPDTDEFPELENPALSLLNALNKDYTSLSVGNVVTFSENKTEHVLTCVGVEPESPSSLENLHTGLLNFDLPKRKVSPSRFQKVGLGEIVEANLDINSYFYFSFYSDEKDLRGKRLVFKVTALEGDPDLFMCCDSSFRNQVIDPKNPGSENYIWSSAKIGGVELLIQPDDKHRRESSTFYGAVRSFQFSSKFQVIVDVESVGAPIPSSSSSGDVEDGYFCHNCRRTVAAKNAKLHEPFCLRNNHYCQMCDRVIRKIDLASHWHCPDASCKMGGNKEEHRHCPKCNKGFENSLALDKHLKVTHTPILCKKCGKSFEFEELLIHRQFQCEKRRVDCEFCGGTFDDSEVKGHAERCGNSEITCEGCNSKVKMKDLKTHDCFAVLQAEGQQQPLQQSLQHDVPAEAMRVTLHSCPYCEETGIYGRDGLEAHMIVCDAAKVFGF